MHSFIKGNKTQFKYRSSKLYEVFNRIRNIIDIKTPVRRSFFANRLAIFISRRNHKSMYYTYQDFNKKDKQLIQSLIKVSVKNEIKNFMVKMLPDHQGMVEKEHEDIRKPYWAFFDSFKDFSKHLKQRYDGSSPRDLPSLLTSSRVEGNLTDVHFADFSDDGKAKFEELFFIEKKRRE